MGNANDDGLRVFCFADDDDDVVEFHLLATRCDIQGCGVHSSLIAIGTALFFKITFLKLIIWVISLCLLKEWFTFGPAFFFFLCSQKLKSLFVFLYMPLFSLQRQNCLSLCLPIHNCHQKLSMIVTIEYVSNSPWVLPYQMKKTSNNKM